MKKAQCEKCRQYTYVYEHHILPQSTFGKTEDTVKLCGNCHTDYHQKLGNKALKNPSIEFHYEKYLKWAVGLSIVCLLAVGLISFMS